MPNRALQVVKPEAPPGDIELTRETMAGWKPGQKRCRARKRHNWGPYTVYKHGTYFDVVEQCTHCRNRRHADFARTSWGLRQATGWKADYREGYLLPRGAGRIDDSIRDELTEADILSRRIVEVDDDDPVLNSPAEIAKQGRKNRSR